MQWTRVKNILILLMLIINALLLGVFLSRQAGQASVRKNSAQDLVAVLREQGVTMLPESIPDDTRPLYSLEAVRDEAFERAVALYLLQDAQAEDQGGNIIVYTGQNGTAAFRGGGNIELALTQPFDTGGAPDAGQAARQLLGRMGFDLTGAQITSVATGSGHTVEIRQSVSQLPVYNCRLAVSLDENNKLLQLSGRWTAGTPAQADTQATKSAAYALLKFIDAMRRAGTPVSDIAVMETGYVTTTAAPGLIRLLPVWHIVASGADYYINALTGALEIVT